MRKLLPFVVLGLGVLLLVSLYAAVGTPVQPVAAARPTWTPGPAPTKTAYPKGSLGMSGAGSIQLSFVFPTTWPWRTHHWQRPWTVVEWQDASGAWNEVGGWAGSFDEVRVADDGTVTGTKLWWVSKSDLGSGPFRWTVYLGEEGTMLGQSEPFHLPALADAVQSVDVVPEL
jgi:hypothetical protein